MTELLTNGDFESWSAGLPVGWEKHGTETISEEKTIVKLGTKAVKGTTTGPGCGVKQLVSNIPASSTLRLSVWQQVDAVAALEGYRVCAELQVVGGTYGGKFLNFSTGEWESETLENEKHIQLFTRAITGRYVKIGYEGISPPETTSIRLFLKRLDGNPFSFYFDSASLQLVETPTLRTTIDWGELQKKVPNDPTVLDSFIADFERPDYVGFFREWNTSILTDSDIEVLRPREITPIIAWEPEESTKKPTPAEIATGSQDAYIDEQAKKIAEFGDTVIIRPYWEFNIGIQSPEGKPLDPTDYIAMWKHIVERFSIVGADNVKWFWCALVDFDREEGNKFESTHDFFPYFPGDEYVDYVGADGYSDAFYDEIAKKARWSTIKEIFFYTYHCMMGISEKPFAIGETGVSEEEGKDKAEWFRQGFLETMHQIFRRTEFWMYFNRHNTGEVEWEVTTSPGAEDAFRTVVRSNLYSNNLKTAGDEIMSSGPVEITDELTDGGWTHYSAINAAQEAALREQKHVDIRTFEAALPAAKADMVYMDSQLMTELDKTELVAISNGASPPGKIEVINNEGWTFGEYGPQSDRNNWNGIKVECDPAISEVTTTQSVITQYG